MIAASVEELQLLGDSRNIVEPGFMSQIRLVTHLMVPFVVSPPSRKYISVP